MERFVKVKIKDKRLQCADAMVLNEETIFDSIDIILNNSNYTLSDLKKMYYIDFYRVLRKVEQKIKAKK